ncbi:hypothetical protein [Acinetobacter sp.]|jgi:hypothetical protein|uniref:Uncharacterized protein n=1 Tax=Acinetobacter bereziniae TaxID=106648 RepID=A0A833TXR4_ACIBZ|nr:hypothetical protein [Acinetobacter sp.]KAF1024967.1 MAG: hypothetical protein GAK29_02231 [Acinetobacter bereziniae]MDR0235520.1 hypothetical protein [Acinetobacter sp.]
MKIIFLFVLATISNIAFASYENSCDLEVKLLENTSTRTLYINKDGLGEVEETSLFIKGIVEKAHASGRADSGCKYYVGQIIEQRLSDYPNRSELKKGEKIKLNILITDYKGIPKSEKVTYLGPNK